MAANLARASAPRDRAEIPHDSPGTRAGPTPPTCRTAFSPPDLTDELWTTDHIAAFLHCGRSTTFAIAADVSWQSRAEILGTIEEVALSAHRFADEVADCYSADRPPSDRQCDDGFALADRVDALAVEVLHRRARDGVSDNDVLAQPSLPPAREARHLARAHVAALRGAATTRRMVTALDVEAAEALYRSVVAVGRQHTRWEATAVLRRPPAKAPPRRPPIQE